MGKMKSGVAFVSSSTVSRARCIVLLKNVKLKTVDECRAEDLASVVHLCNTAHLLSSEALQSGHLSC